MKLIYVTGRKWLDRAAGDAGRTSGLRVRGGRPAGEDKVVDLAAWKAENLMTPDDLEAGRVSALGQYGGRELVRRRRRRWLAAQNRAELAATLAVTAALLALVVRVLLF